MQDYRTLYTWAMDKQAQIEREATERRLIRHSQYVTHDNRTTGLRWPLARRRDDRKAA